MANLNDMSKQRLDFRKGPSGEEIAILTVTLGDKTVHRFEDSADDQEVNHFAKALANAEMKRKQEAGEISGWSEDQIAGLFSSIVKGVKSIGKVARKIATSKVFRKAAKGLVAIAPALGPFAGAAAAVGGGMMVASKLADATIAAESGARFISRAQTGGATAWARRISRGKRGPMRQLINWGNRYRQSSLARAGGRRSWLSFARRRQQERSRYRPQPQPTRRQWQPRFSPGTGYYGRQAQRMFGY